MLTRQERAAIAERLKSAGRLNEFTFYEALTGKQMAPSWDLRAGEISNIIVDLCDTSNMIELPRDKDGEVIHLGDTLYDDDGSKITVRSIRFNSEYNIVITCDGSDFVCTYLADRLTRKNPVSVQSLSKRMQNVLDEYCFSVNSDLHTELSNIADQLKELAGQDE